jgi:hypothetical protein
MNATRRMASLAVFSALCLLCLNAIPASAQDAGAGAAGQQKYTMAEYNAYTAAANEKNPAAQLKALDDFVAKYPNSSLLNYVYPLYYQNYAAQKNYPKVIEYADKELALGDKASATERYQAYSARAFAYNNMQNADVATSKAAYQAALDGAKSVEAFISNFNIGRADLALTPPQQLDAIWAFARAATSKGATEQQSKSVKAYLPKVIASYQGGTVCDALAQAELNELLQLAATSPERPASYKLYSAADLDAARKDMTIASVVTDLKAGGDKAKLTWTAACGLEFPDVPGKIIEVTAGTDAVILKNAFVTSDAEFDAATTPNMQASIKTADQPDAAKLEKGNAVRFTGTLESYDPDPNFMLHWDKAKVNEEDLPKADKKPAKKPATKKPSK